MFNFAIQWTAARQASFSFTIYQSLLKPMSTESVMPSNHLILCHPLLLLLSICPSITVFSNVLTLCIRWPKNWKFSFSISPSKEYSGLISFRIDWFDLAVQRTPKSPPTPQFKVIHLFYCPASALSLFYCLTLACILLKKHHSFDYTELCWQSNASAF